MSEDTAVKLKPFSGKEDEWVYWAPMFLACAEAKGYHEIADGTVAVPSKAAAAAEIQDPARLKLKQLNKTGYCELMALMSKSKVAFMMVARLARLNYPMEV